MTAKMRLMTLEYEGQNPAGIINAGLGGRTIKALSLWQPWATGIALGIKRIETRGKRTNHRGAVAIHAGLRPVDRNEVTPAMVKHLCVHVGPDLQYEIRYCGRFHHLALGAVVAIAEIVDCVPSEKVYIDSPIPAPGTTLMISEQEFQWGDYTKGRFAWILDNVRRLREPIPARGAQGLWNWQAPANLEELLA